MKSNMAFNGAALDDVYSDILPQNITKLNKTELKLVSDYVDCLSPKRAESYASWIEVGWCLHNLHNKDNTLLLKWIEFSKKSGDHTTEAEDACTEFWDNMCDDGLGMGSLKMWAREDNLSKYEEIIRRDIAGMILRASKDKGSSFDIANLVLSINLNIILELILIFTPELF